MTELRALGTSTTVKISESDVLSLMITGGDIGSQCGLTAEDGPSSGWRKAIIDTSLRTHGSRFAKFMDEHLPSDDMSLKDAAKEIAITSAAVKKIGQN
mmetsp:Transcript_792/g.653  ORF Transcript_792/g.653 Transcript_792/m.653 type:complete len:98 (-) Transcript_792:110-403(-)